MNGMKLKVPMYKKLQAKTNLEGIIINPKQNKNFMNMKYCFLMIITLAELF